MSGKYIKIKSKDNQEFSGYLCEPPSGKGPGLILVQEIFGVNSHIKDVAELYAQEGFVVLAPDLFWRLEPNFEIGYSDKEIAKGMEFYTKLDMEQALSDLNDATNALRKLPSVTDKVGAVGYCLGGLITFKLACRNIVDASVSYYGGGINNILDEANNLKGPLLIHLAGDDSYIPPPAIQKIISTLSKNANITIHLYEGVHHGFNCDQRGSYNRQAAMLAYSRSAAFLHKHLEK